MANPDTVCGIACSVHDYVSALVREPPYCYECGSDLRGACGIATWELFIRLRNSAHRVAVVCAEKLNAGNHAYVMVDRGMNTQLLVDVTAAQFGGPPVLIEQELDEMALFIDAPHRWVYQWSNCFSYSSLTSAANALDWGVGYTHPDVLSRIRAQAQATVRISRPQ